MRCLLDTCTFLWMHLEDDRLSKSARRHILDPANELFLSAASSWEISLKARRGKLRLDEPPDVFVLTRMDRNAIGALVIEHRHALRTHELPAHHADPFDRLLVSQAQHEGLVLLSPDAAFAPYDVEVVW